MGLVYHDDVWVFVEDMNKQSGALWDSVFPMPHHRFTRTKPAYPPSYSIHLSWHNNKKACMESSCSGWTCMLQLLDYLSKSSKFNWELTWPARWKYCFQAGFVIVQSWESFLASLQHCIEGLWRESTRFARYRIKLSYNSNLTHFHLDPIQN